MVSFLESQLKNAIAKGFKGKLLVGSLTRKIAAGVDEYGDPITSTSTFSVNGFVDEYSSYYKQQAGIPENSVKIILIAGLSETNPLKDDKISFTGFQTYQVRKVMGDPALAHWECESFA